jgi:oligopeptide/dipeptide ABC transporter ATP-binding protein
MGGPLLSVEGLSVVFHSPIGDVHALRGITFDVERGETFGLVGESGCGKTVTGRSILRILPHPGEITRGRINFEGLELLEIGERQMQAIRGRKISMIFQDPSAALNPVFTIGQQLMEVMQQHHTQPKAALRRLAAQYLASCELPNPKDCIDAYPHQLSGGMQQRAMIAMALSSQPDLLIADEPTTALDVTIQAQILDLLVKIKEEQGISVILITHNMGVVAETCQYVSVLYAGRIAEQGSVSDIFHNAKHPYTQGLLLTLPRPGSRGHDLMVIPGSVPSGVDPLPGCAFAARCEYAMDLCREEQPALTHLSQDHYAACHRYGDQAGGGENG